jgi:hypothetical protein
MPLLGFLFLSEGFSAVVFEVSVFLEEVHYIVSSFFWALYVVV